MRFFHSLFDHVFVLPLGFVFACALCGCNNHSSPPNSGSATKTQPAETTEPTKIEPLPEEKPTTDPPVQTDPMPVETGPAETPPAEESETTAKNETEYSELFTGWDKPLFSLLVTGRQHGYIEPCGCTGLDNQKGGLNRRASLLKQLQEDRGWNVVPVDVGNQVRRFGRQPEIKFQTTGAGLQAMDYQAVTFGPDDLRLSTDEVFAGIVGDDPDDLRFISANVSLFGATPQFRIIEVAGKKIGITGVLGKSHHKAISNDLIEIEDPITGLTAAWAELEAAECDLYVLLSHATLEESREYSQKFPGFQLIVTAGGAGEPTRQPEEIEGTGARMIQTGTKGMYAGVVGVYGEKQLSIRYQRIPLDARFADTDEMMQLLASYQQQLESLSFEELGIRPIPHPSGLQFVGSQACSECHADEFDVWANSPHSHATQSLITPPERFQVPRHFDPECLACHVTGWDQKYYLPYESGYLNLQESPLKRAVSCENCHGPGSQHVAAEQGDEDFDETMIEQFRKQMELPLLKARDTCLKCHDLDNSPDFHVKGAFEEYWEHIKH
ncbi:MAG: hypothetical protein COA78_29785 [Blastopirellula sp.]|nr:MAG: hypothetical protein COA78_29785 [Blastopirellula sp.]